jgi:phospholipid/cholesterol/gamma-HCH transport system substrate-binding protein
MRYRRASAMQVFNNPILVGTVTILIGMVAVYLSYIAENGLPFVPAYSINIQVQNADELVKNADVRIGGALVGQVLTIKPEPATPANPHPYAELGLELQRSLQRLPADTRYSIRLASVLGGKYIELIPGTNRSSTIPDGGTLTISHENPVVDLDTAFKVFGPKTQSGLRGVLQAFGNAVAGRGAQFNDSIYETARLIGPLTDIARTFAARSTNLAGFIDGAASTTGALAPVAQTFTALLADGATTLQALNAAAPALGSALDQLPETESVGTTVLTNAQPVLAKALVLVSELKPAAPLLPTAATKLDGILAAATPVFERAPELAAKTQAALTATERLATTPATKQTFELLGKNDLATLGSSAFVGLGAILHAIAPAQLSCNIAGIWTRNLASLFSEGDAAGTWIRFSPVVDPSLQLELEANAPSSILHVNPYPIENSSECQAGNETYTPGQVIGNGPHTGKTVDDTTPPAGVLARGEAVGLVP